jgi:hypothetical protein
MLEKHPKKRKKKKKHLKNENSFLKFETLKA